MNMLRSYRTKNYRFMTDKLNEMTRNTFKCECGHSVVIIPTRTKKLCSWCGRWVFRSKIEEFKFRVREQLNYVNQSR